jgi:hypothetical protein
MSGHFDVVGCMTGRKYRIYHNVLPPNVFEIDDAGRRKMGLCFAPVGPLVKGDVILAQKIALETDERSALAVANRVFVNSGAALGLSFVRLRRCDWPLAWCRAARALIFGLGRRE